MKLIFEFARIAAFCFAGEVCHLVLPLPIPASVYGLMLLLAALRFGVVKLEQVRTAALFLTGIFPLLFVPAAAGVMDLWADLQAMLVPVLLALIPITILVMTVSGCVTQHLAERKEKKQRSHKFWNLPPYGACCSRWLRSAWGCSSTSAPVRQFSTRCCWARRLSSWCSAC